MRPPVSLRRLHGLWSLAFALVSLLVEGMALGQDDEAPEAVLGGSLEEDAAAAIHAIVVSEPLPTNPPAVGGMGRHELERPLDGGLKWEASTLYCPHYLPDLYPGKNLDELCRQDFFTSPDLFQRGDQNPYLLAKDQFDALVDSADERRDCLPWAAAYALLHRDTLEWGADTVRSLLGRPQYLRSQVIAEAVTPWITKRLTPELTTVQPQEGQVAVDVRVFSNISYDSTASIEKMLVTAGERGIKAVVVADRSRIDGAQLARRCAQRLKSEGRLPEDFLVITGQVAYSHTGAVLAVFIDDPIADNMTMGQTVDVIHRAGGLAYLLHPGDPGGPERLQRFDFDGYLLQPNMFEMFRTLSFMYDSQYVDKPGLAASNAQFASSVGLPHIMVESSVVSAEALRGAMKRGQVSAAGGLYLPWMTLASTPTVARFSRFLNRYFLIHRYAERHVATTLGADSVSLSTTWDQEIRDMMGLAEMPGGIRDLLDGDSPLLEHPRLEHIAVEYSCFQLGYSAETHETYLQATLTW